MTDKDRAIEMIEGLPEGVTVQDILEELQHLEASRAAETSAAREMPLPEGGLWDLLERSAGTVEMPRDWASEHDHYLYSTPKRSSAA